MTKTVFAQTAVALSIGAFSAIASAASLPVFTLDPTAVGGTDAAFKANNIVVSDFSTVTFGAGSAFSETGVLDVSNFQLNGSTVPLAGLNSKYGFYFQFKGTGTATGGDPTKGVTNGSFSSLDYQLYEYNGTASFAPTGATVTGTTTQIAHGSLLQGVVSTSPLGSSFQANAGAELSFVVDAAGSGFFVDPKPFYSLAEATFTNGPQEVTTTATGFTITNGGGSVNFAAAVPEPETYAMMFAGLAVMGFVARRRKAV